jgi:hypothetical protein
LIGGFNVQSGACDITITEFCNQSNGLYDIRIVPNANNPACTWFAGEYIYAALLQFSQTIAGRKVVLQGGTLGKLTISDAVSRRCLHHRLLAPTRGIVPLLEDFTLRDDASPVARPMRLRCRPR